MYEIDDECLFPGYSLSAAKKQPVKPAKKVECFNPSEQWTMFGN